MTWYLTNYLVCTLKDGDDQAQTLDIYSDANWVIKVGLDALVVPAKLNTMQTAFVDGKAQKRKPNG